MHHLLARILEKGPVLTDGAWGTELQARGLAVGDFPDAWNLTHSQQVSEVARSYVAAGSQVILTNTFGANRIRLGAHGLETEVQEINQLGVKLSREAARGQALVFASMGPTGKMVCNAEVTEGELRAVYEEQAQALAAAGADALLVETMAELGEATQAVIAGHATGLPVIACMVYDSGKNKDRTMMGTTPEQASQALLAAGADIVGANCGQGITGFIPICQRLHQASQRPVWIKANAGLPEWQDGRPVYQATPADFAAQVPALIKNGAGFVGGCCGTNPDFIRAVRQVMSV